MVCKVRAQGLFRASGALVSFACHLSGFMQLAIYSRYHQHCIKALFYPRYITYCSGLQLDTTSIIREKVTRPMEFLQIQVFKAKDYKNNPIIYGLASLFSHWSTYRQSVEDSQGLLIQKEQNIHLYHVLKESCSSHLRNHAPQVQCDSSQSIFCHTVAVA